MPEDYPDVVVVTYTPEQAAALGIDYGNLPPEQQAPSYPVESPPERPTEQIPAEDRPSTELPVLTQEELARVESVPTSAGAYIPPEVLISGDTNQIISMLQESGASLATQLMYLEGQGKTIDDITNETVRSNIIDQINNYNMLRGQEQFSRAMELGFIPQGSQYVQLYDKWGYYTPIQVEEFKTYENYLVELGERQKALEENNKRLPDNTWISKSSLSSLQNENPIAYDILTEQGYAAYLQAVNAATMAMKPYKRPNGYRLTMAVANGITKETLQLLFNKSDVDRAWKPKEEPEIYKPEPEKETPEVDWIARVIKGKTEVNGMPLSIGVVSGVATTGVDPATIALIIAAIAAGGYAAWQAGEAGKPAWDAAQKTIQEFRSREGREPTAQDVVIAGADGEVATLADLVPFTILPSMDTGTRLVPPTVSIPLISGFPAISPTLTAGTTKQLIPPKVDMGQITPPQTSPALQNLIPSAWVNWREPVVFLLPNNRVPIPVSVITGQKSLMERTGWMIAAAQKIVEIARPIESEFAEPIDIDWDKVLDEANVDITIQKIDREIRRLDSAQKLDADIKRAYISAYKDYQAARTDYQRMRAEIQIADKGYTDSLSSSINLVKGEISPEILNAYATQQINQALSQTTQQAATRTAQQTATRTQTETQTQAQTQTQTQTAVDTATQAATAAIAQPAVRTATASVTATSAIKRMKFPKWDDQTDEEKTIAGIKGAITWRQGFVWWIIKFPYKSRSDVYVTRIPPKGVTVVTGSGSAYKTIQKLTGQTPSKLFIDMGIMDIRITSPTKAGDTGAIRYRRDRHQMTSQDISVKGIRM